LFASAYDDAAMSEVQWLNLLAGWLGEARKFLATPTGEPTGFKSRTWIANQAVDFVTRAITAAGAGNMGLALRDSAFVGSLVAGLNPNADRDELQRIQGQVNHWTADTVRVRKSKAKRAATLREKANNLFRTIDREMRIRNAQENADYGIAAGEVAQLRDVGVSKKRVQNLWPMKTYWRESE
jgi:hypothetical protein